MAVVRTKRFQIFEYWKDKYITSDGKIIERKDLKENESKNPELVITDWGEPSCRACGKPARLKENASYVEWKQTNNYEKIWNSKEVEHSLQKCHIVPRALQGEDEPHNLFMLCSSCHCESPDTTNESTFIRWVYRIRKKYSSGIPNCSTIANKLSEELESRGLPSFEEAMNIIESSKMADEHKKWLSDGTLREYIKENVGLHYSMLADSSMYGATADVIEAMLEDVEKSKKAK